jgi:hypothetical protein
VHLPLRMLLNASSGLMVSWRIFPSIILIAVLDSVTLFCNSKSLFSSRSVMPETSLRSLDGGFSVQDSTVPVMELVLEVFLTVDFNSAPRGVGLSGVNN